MFIIIATKMKCFTLLNTTRFVKPYILTIRTLKEKSFTRFTLYYYLQVFFILRTFLCMPWCIYGCPSIHKQIVIWDRPCQVLNLKSMYRPPYYHEYCTIPNILPAPYYYEDIASPHSQFNPAELCNYSKMTSYETMSSFEPGKYLPVPYYRFSHSHKYWLTLNIEVEN